MASRVPVQYASAPDLSADARSALANSRFVWDELTEHEREALKASAYSKSTTPRIDSGRTAARTRLFRRGLTTPTGFLTALGQLVLEAGVKMTAEWNPKQARTTAA